MVLPILRDFAVEPGPRHPPLPLHGRDRYALQLCHLIHCQPTAKAQLNNPAFLRIDPRQARQRIIERDQFRRSLIRHLESFVERQFKRAATLLNRRHGFYPV